MAMGVATGGRAERLVAELQRWVDLEWGPVRLLRITLVSGPDEWPPVIRLEFQAGAEQRVWEDPWDVDLLRTEPPDVAAGFWLGVVHAQLCERGLL